MGDGGVRREVFTEAVIATRVETLAVEIAARVPADPVVVGVLVAAFVFTADLVRALGRHGVRPEVEFIRLASYGTGTRPEGPPRLVGPLPARERLAGRAVLVVDTVFDTGHTLTRAAALLRALGVASLHTCVLVQKPSRRRVSAVPDFVGFVAEGFLVGYGLDGGGNERWLPALSVVARG